MGSGLRRFEILPFAFQRPSLMYMTLQRHNVYEYTWHNVYEYNGQTRNQFIILMAKLLKLQRSKEKSFAKIKHVVYRMTQGSRVREQRI